MKMHLHLLPFLIGIALPLSLEDDHTNYTIGDKVEDFTLRNVDGRWLSLSEYAAQQQGVVIVFTCLHCPYAELYEDRIIHLHRKYAPQGYPVLAINPTSPRLFPEDTFENMRKRAKEKRYPFPYLQDSAQVVLANFGASRTPQVYLMDKNWVVRYIGTVDDNAENPRAVRNHHLENAIQALMRGERPSPEITQSIGCPIRRARPSSSLQDTASPRRR